MVSDSDGMVKQYIHKVSFDRKTGEKLSDTFEPYAEAPEITIEEHTNKLLRAAVGDIDKYVDRMLEDLKKQEEGKTSRQLVRQAEGA